MKQKYKSQITKLFKNDLVAVFKGIVILNEVKK